MTTKISIALASYNCESYIRAQLDSFGAQTRLPDELVVCDDCSSDATMEIVQQFTYMAPFVVRTVINDKNVGYIENFSNALELCSGDIVFLSDQDDVWLPTKLSTMEHFFVDHPAVQLAIHDLAYCKEDLTPIGQTKIERMCGTFNLYDSYVVGMASAIRGDFLRRCLPIPKYAGLTHDRWLHLCANALGRKSIVEHVLALHRRHGGNVTSDSLLNVDYVTAVDHFRLNRPGLVARLARMRDDNASRWAESSALLDWLARERDSLVEAGYAEGTSIDAYIAKERRCNEAEALRGRIWADHRRDCVANVYKLYRCGGYAFFRGWKSLVGDLVFRCLLRL